MFQRFFRKEVRDIGALFSGHYIEVKAFYAWQFNRLPCIYFIGELDVTKAFAHINDQYNYGIQHIYQHSWHEYDKNKLFFNNSVFVLDDNRMIELANDYCQVLFTPTQYAWAGELINELAAFRKVAETKPNRVMGFARTPEPN